MKSRFFGICWPLSYEKVSLKKKQSSQLLFSHQLLILEICRFRWFSLSVEALPTHRLPNCQGAAASWQGVGSCQRLDSNTRHPFAIPSPDSEEIIYFSLQMIFVGSNGLFVGLCWFTFKEMHPKKIPLKDSSEFRRLKYPKFCTAPKQPAARSPSKFHSASEPSSCIAVDHGSSTPFGIWRVVGFFQ